MKRHSQVSGNCAQRRYVGRWRPGRTGIRPRLGLCTSLLLLLAACQPSEVPSPTPTSSGGAVDVPSATWFQLTASAQDVADSIATTGVRLSFGKVDSDARTDVVESFAAPLPQLLDLAAPPAIAKATDTTVRVTYEDGAASWIRSFDVDSGQMIGSIRLEEVAAASVADPASGSTWLMLRDRVGLRSVGLWRVDEDGSQEQVLAADVSFDPDPDRGERAWLSLSPDASTLVRWVCDGSSCRIDAIDLASGARLMKREGFDFGRLLGVGGTDVAVTALPPDARSECMATEQADGQPLCPLSLVSLASGAIRAGPIVCEDDVVVPVVAPLTIVVASEHPACGGDRYQLVAVDVESDYRKSIALPSEYLQLAPENTDQGTTLVGSVAMSPTGDFPFASGAEAATIVALPD